MALSRQERRAQARAAAAGSQAPASEPVPLTVALGEDDAAAMRKAAKDRERAAIALQQAHANHATAALASNDLLDAMAEKYGFDAAAQWRLDDKQPVLRALA